MINKDLLDKITAIVSQQIMDIDTINKDLSEIEECLRKIPTRIDFLPFKLPIGEINPLSKQKAAPTKTFIRKIGELGHKLDDMDFSMETEYFLLCEVRWNDEQKKQLNQIIFRREYKTYGIVKNNKTKVLLRNNSFANRAKDIMDKKFVAPYLNDFLESILSKLQSSKG